MQLSLVPMIRRAARRAAEASFVVRCAGVMLVFGADHAAGPGAWQVEILWNFDPTAPEGVVPYRRSVGAWWRLPRILWRTYPRAWGRLDRRFDCGAYAATAWTGRDREIISIRWDFGGFFR